jgi:hypothetical protein
MDLQMTGINNDIDFYHLLPLEFNDTGCNTIKFPNYYQ